jgi:hypothetical protein
MACGSLTAGEFRRKGDSPETSFFGAKSRDNKFPKMLPAKGLRRLFAKKN